MLSPAFAELKRLRTAGNAPAALARVQALTPASDADALEAMVCLFSAGHAEAAIARCRSHAWQAPWARQTAAALASLLARDDPRAALAHARAAAADPAATADATAVLLLLLQANGLVQEAAAFMHARLAAPPAGEHFLLGVMGEIALATGQWELAYRLATAVLSADVGNVRALLAASVATFEGGSLHESLGYAQRAQQASPGAPPAVLQLMRCHNGLGDYYAAIAAFGRLAPGAATPDLHAELGAAYGALDDRARAIEAYESVLAAGARRPDALGALIRLYADTDDRAALAALHARHRADIDGDIECLFGLALDALRRRDLDAAQALLARSFALSRAQGVALDLLPWPVPEPLIRHDVEQLELLAQRGKLAGSGVPALAVLRRYHDPAGDSARAVAPAGADGQALREALTGLHHYPDAPFAGPALAARDYAAVQEQFLASQPSLVVMDDFLAPDALAALRAFCEEATIWRAYNDGGYTGAFLAQGFSPRVLLAIADELRAALPRVIGDLGLQQAWGFKYDRRLRGTSMHADFARVNVNFWITPQDACEDPASGGLVVYDQPAPKSWTFADYNADPARMQAYLDVHRAKATRIPYRENRCILFDSRVFHVTDDIRFKAGYTHRRVNVTLLYGKAAAED